MDKYDMVFISYLKKLLMTLPGMKGAKLLFDGVFSIAALEGILLMLFVGEAVIIYIKSDRFKKRWEKSNNRDSICNLITIAGIITILVVFS